MDLEIEITENPIAPSLTTQPNGRLRLSFHWHDEISRVLATVTHPLRDAAHDGFLELWASNESERSFEQLSASTVLIRTQMSN